MAKIQLIDDDEELSSNIAEVLEQYGHTVSMLCDHHKALATLLADTPDLLVLDVMFPDNPVAGFHLARQIRRNRQLRDLPIILLTGVNQEFPVRFTTEDAGDDWMPVHEFIEKPVKPEILIEKIRRMLEPGT